MLAVLALSVSTVIFLRKEIRMIPIIYRTYKYSPLATFFSAGSFLLAFMFIIGAAASFQDSIVGAVILGILGLACAYECFAHKLADKIAEKNGRKNIETKARYGFRYLQEHPEAYDYIVSVNEAFNKKYQRLDDGQIAKR